MLLEVNQLQTVLRTAGRDVLVVDSVDLQLSAGETLCLVGESGSGKSITALSIMRLLPSMAVHPGGAIWLTGGSGSTSSVDLLTRDDEQMSAIRGQRMAMIFQEPMSSLNPVFTVGEQIAEALQFCKPDLSWAETRSRSIETMHEVRIDDPESRFDNYPHQLSGGQRQRIMIAMALICQPDVLIADEPTTALDVTVQAGILTLIKQLQVDKGMAVLFITHDLGVVAQIADRVAVMRQGQIVEQGVSQQVLYKPGHSYTRELLSALPENLPRVQVPSTRSDEVLAKVCDLKVHFPQRGGLLRRVKSQIRAVDGVSLEIRRGEIVALVGESGSGKSTLGRALVRLVAPTSGAIFYDGTDVTRFFRQAVSALSPPRAVCISGSAVFIESSIDGGRNLVRTHGGSQAG